MHECYIEGTQQLESHAGAYYLGNASSKCANHRGLYKPITAKDNGSKGDAYPIPFQKTQTKLSKRRDQIRKQSHRETNDGAYLKCFHRHE